MKILFYDCFSGISGDMNLAALIDLGVDQSYLIHELEKLGVQGYSISFVPDQRKGISGIRADVILSEDTDSTVPTFSYDGLKILSPKKNKTHHSNHQDRTYADIRKLIQDSHLNDFVKKTSLEIFHKIAVAEAHVHGKPIDKIHFHEVGAVDSIVDIVGAAIGIDYLKPDKIMSTSVQLGGGTVTCAHGVFPVPAPATAEILKGIPVKLGSVNKETTTPTGAAILAALVTEFTDKPNFKITKIAYGIGHRDNELPNVLRLCLAETDEKSTGDYLHSFAFMVECNIDDMNPEMYEYIMNLLFEAGADDVYFQPVTMKKSRPATKVGVLCQSEIVPLVENILLLETTTLGIRKYEVQKTMLHRNWKTIETKWGAVKIKLGLVQDKIVKWKPEYEDCLRLAKEHQIPITEIYSEISNMIDSLRHD